MKTKLITALRAAASAIEAGTFDYTWKYTSRCNCGALFCALTGNSAAYLPVPKKLNKGADGATWKDLVGQYCPITGVPHDKLFRELFSYGLTQQDIINLEYMSDRKVIARMRRDEGPEPAPATRNWWQRLLNKKPKTARRQLYFDCKEHVVAYMRAWADLLTEEGAMDVPASTTPESVTQQD